MRVGILTFDGVDLLDVGGPYEVFLTASRLAQRRGNDSLFVVETLSHHDGAVVAYGGLGLVPSAGVDDPDGYELVVVPGTVDLAGPVADVALLETVARLANEASIVASVCTGAFLLAAAGVLDDEVVATHWEDASDLEESLGAGRVRRGVRWVDEGTVVTSGGLSSGIAMALHLVDRICGMDLAVQTAYQLEYDWEPDGSSSFGAPGPSDH